MEGRSASESGGVLANIKNNETMQEQRNKMALTNRQLGA